MRRNWLTRGLLVAVAVVAAAVGIFFVVALRPAIAPVTTPPPSTDKAQIKRGAELAAIGNCITCHTREDGRPYAGGRPIATPFGTVYATNITPDVETGIGGWSEAAFTRAMRDGVRRDGAHLYPAFPYDHMTKMREDDIKAVYAFMMTRQAGAGDHARQRSRLPVQHPRHGRRLEASVPGQGRARAQSIAERRLESRRLPRRRARPLRRLSYAAQCARRREAQSRPMPAENPTAGSRRRSTPPRPRRCRGMRSGCIRICARASTTCTASPPARWHRWCRI